MPWNALTSLNFHGRLMWLLLIKPRYSIEDWVAVKELKVNYHNSDSILYIHIMVL